MAKKINTLVKDVNKIFSDIGAGKPIKSFQTLALVSQSNYRNRE